jgi:zinc/manganese transport system permease protein
MALSVVLAVATVWTAIAASYTTNRPVGFFVGVIGAFCYGIGRGWTAWRRTRIMKWEGNRDRGAPAVAC